MKAPVKNINHLRYAYYCSFDFYNFLGTLVGAGIAAVVVDLQFTYRLWNIALSVPTAILSGFFLSLLTLKTFFCIEQRAWYRAGVYGGLNAIPCSIGCYFLFENASSLFLVSGLVLVAASAAWVIATYARSQRIKIYPNRIIIGKQAFHYNEMVNVIWGVGPLDRTKKDLNEEQRQKAFEILTPLLFESAWKDFSLSHYYILIEMPDTIFVTQPVFWRNSFAQNARNGWLETWRWDGTMMPPKVSQNV
jgi:hypothetical protein